MWFLDTLNGSLDESLIEIESALLKNQFWQKFSNFDLHENQRAILNFLLENNSDQGISASQYLKLVNVSKATATRHLTDLLDKGCLIKLEGSGRNTRYKINLHND